ncbi:MAG: UvrD-helicase domain-containing protein [Oligoflexia bacterium]|nr:UvrD-helicase domain-containing protein [Oligoflexia bacterium]
MSSAVQPLRTPNDEQKLAIEHNGGFLLEAGAGSGKTFVLVEHTIFLLNKFLEDAKNKQLNEIDISSSLRTFMSKKVLMTFTKKAAGELSLRLHRRIVQQMDVDTENTIFWKLCLESLDYMTVTTIDGFCFKLLTLGIFKNVPVANEIIGPVELRSKIEKLFIEWVLYCKNTEIFDQVKELVLIEKKDLISAMVSIFQSPELRALWKKFDLSHNPKLSEEVFRILELEGLTEINKPFSIFAHFDSKGKNPKYVTYFQGLEEVISNNDITSLEGMSAVLEYAAAYGRHPSVPKKTAPEELIEYNELLKKYIKFAKDYLESFQAYENDFDTKILPWASLVKNLFNFIEKNYIRIPGLTFADLEYYVLEGLDNVDVQDSLYEKFDYIIVDEFQDTSEIQFEIIEKLVKSNYQRIFCVGDMKQAIYGFRGGELGVFKRCLELVPRLSMTNNYRSQQNIIEYNNLLFENLFKKGEGFAGADSNSVPVEYQKYPGFERNGILKKVSILVDDIEETKTLDQGKIECIEAQAIYDYLTKDNLGHQVCLLYRKLTPTKYLVPLFIKNNIGFTCQIKIQLSSDPIIGIFSSLIETLLMEEAGEDINSCFLKIASYLSLMNLGLDSLDIKIRDFVGDVKIVGVWSAFQKFLFSNNISNSNYKNNLNLVQSICSQSNGNPEEVLKLLGVNSSENYSIEFQFGENVEKIVIMTAHASKGLEFDEVVLAGIHTNGRRQGNRNKFGKLPWSFKWKSSSFSKKYYKSPVFIYEDLLNIKKEFSESKRLFYVACTRACHTLTWFDIEYGGKPSKYSDNSWIVGLRSWENDAEKISEVVRTHINQEKVTNAFTFELDENELKLLNNPKPFFHKDTLGVHSSEESMISGFSAETSVTKLALLTQCPRKYYLKNILKLDDIWLNQNDEDDIVNFAIKEGKEDRDEEAYEARPKTSLEQIIARGIEVHDYLSKMILRNFVIPMDCPDFYHKQLNFIKSELESRQENYSLVSEVPLKFVLFGQMISGTPDLVLVPKDKGNDLEIWDFKTGRYNEEKLGPYWFQLQCYAVAYAHEMGDTGKVNLTVSFVDDQKNITRSYTLSELKDELFKYWQKLSSLSEENTQHCLMCPYGNLCHPNTDSIAQN